MVQRCVLGLNQPSWLLANALIVRAFALAHQLAHPVYDCLSLALAEQASVHLVTDDHRLIKPVSPTRFRKRVRALEGRARSG